VDDLVKPLANIRVLELARILAGPWAGQLLADLGARVIKVERPHGGDDTRTWGPPFIPDAGAETQSAAYFHATNRGKRSVALDFATPEGREAVQQLARQADVIIENFKVGTLASYGLDYESVRAGNPGVVYCSITGFGQTGPYAPRAGYDFIIQGMGGIMDLTGDPKGEPQKTGVAFADIFTGVYATVGILAALNQRATTGIGAHVDMALLDTQVSVLANQAMNYLASGEPPTRLGNAHPNIVPYQLFPTSDGEIIIASGNDSQYVRLCQLLGRPDLAADERFTTNAGRVRNRAALIPLIAAETSKRSSSDLVAGLEAAGIPAGPVNSLDEVFRDPQVVARGLRRDLNRSDGSTVPSVRSPIVINGEACVADRPGPRLGENGREVMRALADGSDPWAGA
jgi:crotonobetainyl-CoA:carnitine CoA-transferase CaiB-like acyl-CoA transferase